MTLLEKLSILSDAAKYDASCASGGSRGNDGTQGRNTSFRGICHSWSEDGRCISLLKLLFTNRCVYDCAYCVNRRSNDVPRAAFTPDEIADLTVNFYRRNYIEGLFLSSAVEKSPDHTMERLVETARLLREDRGFKGYLHLKAIPGADPLLVARAGLLADRVSVNIELPSEASLRRLAPQKERRAILLPMGQIAQGIRENRSDRKRFRSAPAFAPAGQSTQLIVGASGETDRAILFLSQALYDRMALRRVYYSAYVPVGSSPLLPALPAPPLLREHRIYQADWLMRFYGFKAEEILPPDAPNFDTRFDPKIGWALRNLHLFPVEVNRAPYELLLRVPGIGVTSARRIVAARRLAPLDFEALRRMRIVLSRARHFITAKGGYRGGGRFDPECLANLFLQKRELETARQLSLFDIPPGSGQKISPGKEAGHAAPAL